MNIVETEQYIAGSKRYQVVDVRTSSEFCAGSIPGSINIPLFDEEERERIGIIYKKSPRAARFVALDILGPKLPKFIRRVHGQSFGFTPLLVCWRGGMRSKVATDLLSMAGVACFQLRGGYKGFRRLVFARLSHFTLQCPLIVLKGKSGTGKTEIIKHLSQLGVQVINLEKLAGHRGSTFGGFSHSKPANQKNFESNLLLELDSLIPGVPLVVEGESKRIGNIFLPDFLYQAMKEAPVLEIETPLPVRVQRITGEYSPQEHVDQERILRGLSRLQSRISKDKYNELCALLDCRDYAGFVARVLSCHYDNIYDYQLPGEQVLATIQSEDTKKAAIEIAALLNNNDFSDSD